MEISKKISLKEFFSNIMTSSISVAVLIEHAAVTTEEIDLFILPNIDNTLDLYMVQAPKSDFAKKLNTAFKRGTLAKHKSFAHALKAAYTEIRGTQGIMVAQINGLKSKRNIFTDQLKMKEATIVRFQHDLIFMNEFTSRMLALFWRAEMNVLNGKRETDGILRGEIEYFNKNLATYLDRLSRYYIDSKTIREKMENIPDLIFEQATADTVFALTDKNAIDPFASNLSAVELNPFFIVGKIRIEWQEARYQAMLLDKQRIELRINTARQRASGGNDAAAEKLLEALEDRRSALQVQINKMQENS